ncbi:MAG: MotA/TolQ/ExbB proton channel family protein [Halodesulfovibrio sp.]|uniref:MotA/TolQ/ExbB proton channel family protein n=1 Tax=Halodesulfovibrio sp. TaxID=1912772 RepID=UPI00359E7323
MRTSISTVLIALFLLCSSVTSFAASADEVSPEQWQKTIKTLKQLNITHKTDVKKALDLSSQNKVQLTGKLAQLKKAVSNTDIQVHTLTARYQKLIKDEAKLTALLKSRREEIKTFEGTVRTAAKLMQDRSRTSFYTQQNPERLAAFATLLAPDRMPGLTDLTRLIEMYFNELQATADVSRYSSTIIGSDGQPMDVEIIRTGTSSAVYQSSTGEAGFLQLTGDGTVSQSVNGISSQLSGTISAAFAGEQFLPLDFSHGAAFIRFIAEEDTWKKIAAGGALVWPILGIGAIALLLAIERFITLSRLRRSSPKELTVILEHAEQGEWEECHTLLEKRSTPTARVLNSTLKKAQGSAAALEKGMEEALMIELARMERFLPTMQTLAAVAPLLGLLGTVTGMINTFQVITLFGTGDPHMLSGGISEALVTTQLGLAVAIPIMMLHHLLNSRVDRLANDMEEKGTALIATILNRR